MVAKIFCNCGRPANAAKLETSSKISRVLLTNMNNKILDKSMFSEKFFYIFFGIRLQNQQKGNWIQSPTNEELKTVAHERMSAWVHEVDLSKSETVHPS